MASWDDVRRIALGLPETNGDGDRAQALQLGLGIAGAVPVAALDALDRLVDAHRSHT